MQELLDFDVAIEPLGDGYRARVVGSPAGEAYADFALPFTDENLTILILEGHRIDRPGPPEGPADSVRGKTVA